MNIDRQRNTGDRWAVRVGLGRREGMVVSGPAPRTFAGRVGALMVGSAILVAGLIASISTARAQTNAPATPPANAAPAAGGSSAAVPSPGSAEYRLSLGDTIRITVFQSPDLSLETRITESGAISYPLLGSVTLMGMSVPQAEKRIADGLRDGNFLKQPQVSINVIQVRGNQVSVLGQVGRPGRYPLESGDVRLSDIIATAGGILPTGSDAVVIVGTREGKQFRQEVDMPTVFGPNRASRDITLQNGDVIWIERAPTIYIYGEVQRPGSVRLERGMTLMQAMASAGGVTQRGTIRGIEVHRKDTEGKTTILQPAMTDTLKPDDVVRVKESFF
jgi:polysaccharide biosynthesis/export protein